jgi:hypothetical protein
MGGDVAKDSTKSTFKKTQKYMIRLKTNPKRKENQMKID